MAVGVAERTVRFWPCTMNFNDVDVCLVFHGETEHECCVCVGMWMVTGYYSMALFDLNRKALQHSHSKENTQLVFPSRSSTKNMTLFAL